MYLAIHSQTGGFLVWKVDGGLKITLLIVYKSLQRYLDFLKYFSFVCMDSLVIAF